ncbi:MAG: hypothetical protein NTV49_07860 [Kiritimatiellaeota bacterium]|nr:hypothetical protein [Kiritimatiellota bacterium]
MKGSALILAACVLALRVAGGQGAPAPAASGPGLDELKKQYEAIFTDLQIQDRDSAKILKQRYLAGLAALEESLQAAGSKLSAVLVVHGEKERFEQSGTIPDSALAAELPALRKLQETWLAQTDAWPREQAQRWVAASERYLQCLAQLQKNLAARNDTNGVEAVKASKERLLNNKMTHQALELVQKTKPEPPAGGAPAVTDPTAPVGPAATIVEVGAYKFYPPGKEPPLKNLQPWRMDFPSADRRAAQFFYDVRISLVTDKSAWAGAPRITVAAKNRDIPAGSTLVLEYFSRFGTRTTNVYLEKTEPIILPKIARGQSYIVDGQGVSAGYYYHYGLIASIFDEGGKLLFQQCGPSPLNTKCTDRRPE